MVIHRILTEKNVLHGCYVIGGGIFVYFYGCDSIGGEYYVKYTQKYINGEPAPVGNVLKFRYNTVLDDLKVSKFNRDVAALHITDKLDPITLGSSKVKQGIKVGVPAYYQEVSADAIRNSDLKIQKKPVDWSSQEGEQLLQSLCLSETAQKFALAKAVLMGDNYYHLFRAVFPPFFICGFMALSNKILGLRKMHLRSSLYIVSTYMFSGILFTLLYLFCNEAMYIQYDNITDDEALDISYNYLLGGIEFQQKRLERNKALRNLIKNGHRYYDEDGDEKYFGKPLGTPSSIKVKLFDEKLKQFEFDKKAFSPPPVNPNPHPIR